MANRVVDGFRVKPLWPRAELGRRHVGPDECTNAMLQIRGLSARELDDAANVRATAEAASDRP
jgi:hypothetical protein